VRPGQPPHAEARHVPRQSRLRDADPARGQVAAQGALAGHRHPRQDLADGVAARLAGHQVTRVPTPRSVNSSATMLYGTRPSTTCTAWTPPASAVVTACALTCMP